MNASEIVVHSEQGHGIRVVLDLLWEGIREAREPASVWSVAAILQRQKTLAGLALKAWPV